MPDLPLDLLRRRGITRVGDLTDLDTIGIPVWFATRPNARSLSVSQGKGLTHDHARISAIMEAIEGAYSERPEDLVSRFGSMQDFADGGVRTVPLDRSMLCNRASCDRRRERAWVEGRSQASGEPVFAPYEIVGLDMRSAAPWDHEAFRMSSVGIAAGFSHEDVARHALLELLEHDATAFADCFTVDRRANRAFTVDRGVHDDLDRALEKLAKEGVEAEFQLVPSRFGLPVVNCAIARSVEDAHGPAARRSGGVACRPDLGDATLAALLEAVQSRLTHISGARDDIAPDDYHPRRSRSHDEERPATSLDMLCREFEAAPPVERSYDGLARHLRRHGVADIFEFRMTDGSDGLHVVKLVVPELQIAFDDGLTEATPALLGEILQTMAAAP